MLRRMPDLTLGEAARAIGVSADTLRRWDRAGKLRTVRDARNRRLVPEAEVSRLTSHPRRHGTGERHDSRQSALGHVRRYSGRRPCRGRHQDNDHHRIGGRNGLSESVTLAPELHCASLDTTELKFFSS